jgi:small GTP-binding protein
MKVMIIGKENTGKTSLIKRITKQWKRGDKILSAIRKRGVREPTDGIDTKIHNVPHLGEGSSLHLWDFAGQEVFYTTHQFFLSQGTVALLVFDCTKSFEENKISFWMSTIQERMPGSTIYLIGSCIDLIKGNNKSEEKTNQMRQISKDLENLFQHHSNAIGEHASIK